MTKLCITTYYDDAFEPIGRISEETIRQYAYTFGYDVRVFREPLTDRPPAWNKIRAIQQVFAEGYDFVLWVDADALFVRFDADIRDVIEADKHLYLVRHPLTNADGTVPNSGVLLLRNTPWLHELLETLWAMEDYLNHPWWENAALMNLLGYYSLLEPGAANELNETAHTHIRYMNVNWNSIPESQPRFMGDEPIIIHFAGQANSVRLLQMHLAQVGLTLAEARSAFAPFDKMYAKQFDFQVQRGPFEGMRYVPSPKPDHAGLTVQHLLGAYERELHDVVEDIFDKEWQTIINVGCAEGYYAVGSALRAPQAQVYAFDFDKTMCEAARKAARLNGVAHRVEVIADRCTRERLIELIDEPERTLLIIDCEGCETLLLDPEIVTDLKGCTLLIELHNFEGPKTPILSDRFSSTHTFQLIEAQHRDPTNYPELRPLAAAFQQLALDELRPTMMEWFYIVPQDEINEVAPQNTPDTFFYGFDETLKCDLHGWSVVSRTPEGMTYRWMTSTQSAIILPLSVHCEYSITIGIIRAVSQTVLDGLYLSVDGQRIEFELTATDEQGFIYHGELPVLPNHESHYITLIFYIPEVLTPAELGWNPFDHRRVGIAFNWLRIEPR